MASPGNQHCASCIGTLSFPVALLFVLFSAVTHEADAASTSASREARGAWPQGCSGAGTRWNAVPAPKYLPERRSGKYRWPQMER